MKKFFKQSVVTNVILVSLFLIVAFVGFLPEKTVAISSSNAQTVIYNGNRNKKQVSLMFNVYENSKVVNAIIDQLNDRGLKATFFVGGCWADDNQATLCRMVEGGHEIANHGYFHKDHKKLGYDGNLQEIKLTGTIIYALCNYKATLFAPPSGSFSEQTLMVASELGYKVIMWSKDTIDWRDNDVEKVFSRATKNVTNGDLVLMHPKEHTLKALPRVLDYYQSIGLKQVTVSQNLL